MHLQKDDFPSPKHTGYHWKKKSSSKATEAVKSNLLVLRSPGDEVL